MTLLIDLITQLFYNLLTEYKIGGHFLKIIRNLYESNKIFVQTSMGLTQPFTTTVGVLQGCVLSPILFNLFLNKTTDVINTGCDNHTTQQGLCCATCCDPVLIGNNRSSSLMWCDDLVVFSKSAAGLQNTIDRISQHFNLLGLSVNETKTKVVIFNNQGGFT